MPLLRAGRDLRGGGGLRLGPAVLSHMGLDGPWTTVEGQFSPLQVQGPSGLPTSLTQPAGRISLTAHDFSLPSSGQPPQGLSPQIPEDSPQPQPLTPHHSVPRSTPPGGCQGPAALSSKSSGLQNPMMRRAVQREEQRVLLSASASTLPPASCSRTPGLLR